VTRIAAALCLSDKTISTYRARILHKLMLKTSAELVRYAIQRGLVE
jgi:DNA-binding NarL/FixJ family response regulator